MLNKVLLIGNLGADPENRTFPSGGAVTSLRVATTETWHDKQTGERKKRTEWHRVEMYNRLAEIASQYLRKGSKVYLEGSIRTDKWQGQDGQDRYTTKIVAREMKMLDSRGDGGTHGGDGGSQVSNQHQGRKGPLPGGNQGPMPASVPADGDFDDDIPF